MEPDNRTDDERDLGFGYSTTDPYLTGNDDDSPDSPEILDDGGLVIRRGDRSEAGSIDEGLPGAGDSRVGLGDAAGTEDYNADPRDSTGHPHDQAELGDADFRTQEAVYHQYTEHAQEP